MIGVVLMSLVVGAAIAQSAPQAQETSQETQVLGFWTDQSTGLMWAARDSGKDESDETARYYCGHLQLGGHSDWRLATLAELQSIYDKAASAPGLGGPHGKDPVQWHVKGNLFLTGHQWAYDLSWWHVEDNVFDFNDGSSKYQSTMELRGDPSPFMRALCVRESAPQGQEAAQETQARGFWTDPSTGLMWPAKDSGKDKSYKGAVNYCRDLRLAGHSDWRLATMGDLRGIYDRTANAPGLAGPHHKDPFQFHVKGNLFLIGDPWAYNLGGYTGGGDGFDFNQGRPTLYAGDFLWFSNRFRPALCVRESAPQGQEGTQETQVRGFWTDPNTSLMWAAKDNGNDVSYENAVNYCHDLRLAGQSDWRLAIISELRGIYVRKANAPGLAGKHGEAQIRWHVKGNLFLTGYPWAYGAYDRNGRSGWESFNFDEGRSNQLVGFEYASASGFMRALCVRDSGK
jgi:hypothetical protein